MPVLQIQTTGSQIKIYKHEALRKILADDLNTLSGVNLSGSQLETLLLVARTIIGRGTGNAYIGFRNLTFDNSVIHLPAGVIITPDAVYRVDATDITPTPEADWGLIEAELVQTDTDQVTREFFDQATESSKTALSNTRRAYSVKLYENYNVTPAFPTPTPGRIQLLQYQKVAAFQNLNQASLSVIPDFDFLSVIQEISNLYAAIGTEATARQTADDQKNYVRVAAGAHIGMQWFIKEDGNAVYRGNSPTGPWLPFA